MNVNTSRQRLAAFLVVAALLASGCATTRPGEDKLLVRSQQTYETARETFNVLFVLEDENEALIESKLPGTHAKVEKLRVLAKANLPRLLRAIDAYSAASGGGDLTKALAVIEQALREAQDILAASGG